MIHATSLKFGGISVVDLEGDPERGAGLNDAGAGVACYSPLETLVGTAHKDGLTSPRLVGGHTETWPPQNHWPAHQPEAVFSEE